MSSRIDSLVTKANLAVAALVKSAFQPASAMGQPTQPPPPPPPDPAMVAAQGGMPPAGSMPGQPAPAGPPPGAGGPPPDGGQGGPPPPGAGGPPPDGGQGAPPPNPQEEAMTQMLEGLKQVADHSGKMTEEITSMKSQMEQERNARLMQREELIRAQEQIKHLEHALRTPIGSPH